jgi:hypothetical protein
MKIVNVTFIVFLVLCIIFTDKIMATNSPLDNACPPLSAALISPNHQIYKQLNRDYVKLGRDYRLLRSRMRYLSTGSVEPDLNGKITGLIKVGDYGVADWTKDQRIAVFFQKNKLALAHSSMIGYYEQPCINCQDDDAAVESLERILPEDANVQCIYKLYFENKNRFSKRQ